MSTSYALTDWFKSVGVELHPSLYLKHDAVTGLSVYTSQALPPDTTAVTVPASLCITSDVAYHQICQLLGALTQSTQELELEELPKPDWILLYLVLCRLAHIPEHQNEQTWSQYLVHIPYVVHIPAIIPTPLHFTSAEMDLLASTPLYASTERRLHETEVDYIRAARLLRKHLHSVKHGFTATILRVFETSTATSDGPENGVSAQGRCEGLELWRWAESAFTSRAFPSRLIGVTHSAPAGTTSGVSMFSQSTSDPILIPAYDTFNHARAHPVTWSHLVDPVVEKPATGKVAMVLNYDVSVADTQVFNNYGGKSNEEFLSGYGFTLPTMTEDTLALKLSPLPSARELPTAEQTHYWPMVPTSTAPTPTIGQFVPAQCPCPTLLIDLQARVLQDESVPVADQDRLDLYATVLETLETLLLTKRKAFKKSQTHIESMISSQTLLAETPAQWNPRTSPSDIRTSVWSNVRQYRTGQLEILNSAVTWTRTELSNVADAIDTE